MTRSRPHRTSDRSRRRSVTWRGGHTFAGAATATSEAWDVTTAFTTEFGAIPQGLTLGPIAFDLGILGTGTGTGLNSVTVGFMVGPDSLDAIDMDPVSQANFGFWYVRKFYLQNNSNGAGAPWADQGQSEQFHVNTRRKLVAMRSSLWVNVRPDFTGFTAVSTTIDMRVNLLYP
jgi:hypothetical protein